MRQLFTEGERSALLEVVEPDHSFEKGKGPKLGSSHIARAWKLIPQKAGAIQLDDGTFGVLVSDKEMVPEEARPYSNYSATQRIIRQAKNAWIYAGEDLPVILHALPDLKHKFEMATGHHVDVGRKALPYWYADTRMQLGLDPITSFFEVEEALKGQGWKKDSLKYHKDAMSKTFGSVAIAVELPDYHRTTLFMFPKSFPRGVETIEPFMLHIQYKGKFGKDLDEEARKLAAAVKEARPAKRKTDTSKIRWGGKEGRAALALLKKDAEAAVLDFLRPPTYMKPQPITSQRLFHLILDYDADIRHVHSNEYGGLERAEGLSRRQLSKILSAVLNKLAKEGKIEKDTSERTVKWWPVGS